MSKTVHRTYAECVAAIVAASDCKLAEFSQRILKSDYEVLGANIPTVRKIAQSVPIENRDDVLESFFVDADKTFESVMLAGMIAASKGDGYEKTRDRLMRVVKFFGSWAHVDSVTPLLRWADSERLIEDFGCLSSRAGEYQTRFFIMILFSCCLDDAHINMILDTLADKVPYGRYYVDMAAAWLLAECLVKYYDKTIPLFERRTFPDFVHNRALQKARESFRIPPDIKRYLNTLKIRG